MQLNHLYILVRDLDRSRAFYERYLGFDGPCEWQAETFVIRNSEGFALALTPDPNPPRWPPALHFGFLLGEDLAGARSLYERLNADGVPMVESIFEPGFAVFKFADPDGYVIEVEAGAPGGAQAELT
jgi:catechol 2,3-dioxygenase-like lactoylglutathione lyase family enzyme